jgi:hypothetical protein
MENFGLLITIILTGMGIIIAMGAIVVTLFLWSRGEANADRRDIVNLIVAIKEDVKLVQLEMKDFHNRLCSIEERNRK